METCPTGTDSTFFRIFRWDTSKHIAQAMARSHAEVAEQEFEAFKNI